MPRHLKVIAKPNERREDYTDVMIVRQSHLGAEFGEVEIGPGDQYSVWVYNGVKLFSDNDGPAFDEIEPEKCTYFVRGARNKDNHAVVQIPNNLWPQVKEAIEAYNEHYKGD